MVFGSFEFKVVWTVEYFECYIDMNVDFLPDLAVVGSKLALERKANSACYYYAWTGLFSSAFAAALLRLKQSSKIYIVHEV